ncbi:flagellar biosynthesis regulator FlaF [Thalassovita sp. S70]|uniref:flagellar biosynthesis regulator FlaF n=1 Tax=Thalassovita sp. S70 TaxID=3415123 RepID=UPI000C1156EC|nr:flagellar biosynthesis regulator FlhF [Paracoccaceae bacterium]MBT26115.1 flagellar biosynthesis regulator FlhF [Paracoccaceae bacterium]
MNAFNTAQRAYAQTAGPIRTPRGLEYEAFARITHRLKRASDSGSATALAAAVHLNRQLWTLLATDVADEANALPNDLRARIFYLSEFTAQYSRKVLRRTSDIQPLVDINTAMMRGLKQQEGHQ